MAVEEIYLCVVAQVHGTLVMVQVVCQDKKVVVAEAKTSCEQLLVAIVQDKRIADEQERQVRLRLSILLMPYPMASPAS